MFHQAKFHRVPGGQDRKIQLYIFYVLQFKARRPKRNKWRSLGSVRRLRLWRPSTTRLAQGISQVATPCFSDSLDVNF